MAPEHVAGIGLLGVGLGAVIGWVVARRIDEQRARRDAHARYLAAIDEVTGRMARRWGDIQHNASPLEPHPDHQPARVAFTALLILGSREMVELANSIQDAGNDIGRLVATRDIARARTDEWEAASGNYSTLRRDYINRARREVWAGALPGRLFETK